MTKTHKIKLALLGATACFAATSAHAQVADTWAVNGDVTVTAANTATDTKLDPVTGAVVAGIDGGKIDDGFKNSISGSAVGASASSSFSSVNNSGNGGDASLAIDGAVIVSAGNASAVLNNNDIVTGAIIGAGSSNSISLAAVGSSASVSGSTTLSDVGGSAVGDSETYSYKATSLLVSSGTADGSVDVNQGSVDGGNDGTVSLILATGFNTPDIAGGFGNSISVAGVGSSASASFSATVGGDGSVLDTFAVDLGDGATISSANSENGVVAVGLLDVGIVGPKVEGGNANSISAAAVGSSASFSLASNAFGGGVISQFDAIAGPVTVDLTNGATVSLSADGVADTPAPTAISDAAISGEGNGNSISASAVGSSGSVSFANTVYDTSGGAGAGTVSFADITVNSTNNGAVLNATDLTNAAGIDGGSRNSISIAGVGASASQALSITDYSGGGATAVNSSVDGAIILAALNTGTVNVSGGMAVPAIAAGFSNSISAAAVGASASQSVTRTLIGAQ